MSKGVLNSKSNVFNHFKIKNGCWEWQLSLNGGYGQFAVAGKMYAAHRLAYEIYTKKAIPKNMCVCHTCDNPKCINPDHLFLGNSQDNIDDKVVKGRQAKGEKINTSKLTRKRILQIKEQYTKGVNQVKLAEEHNVSQVQISSILRNKSWKYISKPCKTRRSKLTERQVKIIFNNRKCLPINHYTNKYNVSKSTVDKIRSGETWNAIARKANISLKQRRKNHAKGELKARSL